MDYEQIAHLLPDYVKGRLNESDSRTVRTAVERSASLQKELHRLEAYYGALELVDEERAPGDFLSRVNAGIDRETGLRGLLRRLLFPLHVKLPLELVGLGVTALLVVMLFNPFTLENVPREFLEEGPPLPPDPVAEEQRPAAGSSRAEEDAEHEAPEQKRRPKAQPKAPPRPPRRADAKAKKRGAEPASPRREPSPPVAAAAPSPKAARPQRDRIASALRGPQESDRLSDKLDFAPEPPAAAAKESGGVAAQKKAAPLSPRAEIVAPPPASAPQAAADDAAGAAEEELMLERRQLRRTDEAVAVMTLDISDRSIDDSDVRSRRHRGDDEGLFESVAHKAWHLVEETITRHGGTIGGRVTVLSPDPRRIYTVSLAPSSLEALRRELRALGTLEDIDLNLEAAGANRISFRLGVTVK